MAFDRHVPPPGKTHPAFRAMQKGESVFVPHKGSILKCGAYLYAKTIQKRNPGYAFAGRSTNENGVAGVRIWRV